MAQLKYRPVRFTLSLTGTGTNQWDTQLLLPNYISGRVLGVIVEVDDSSALSSADIYILSRRNDTDVSSTPSDIDLAYSSATLSPADDSPAAFLEEVINYPLTFEGLKLAMKLTWTGACEIAGTIHVELN